MSLSNNIKILRQKNNMSQEKLADLLNISRQAVSKWESGQSYPDTENLIQLSKIFNTTVEDLTQEGRDIHNTSQSKCKYCGKHIAITTYDPGQVKSDSEFCSNGCKNDYEKGINSDEKNKKWFVIGLVISTAILLVSALIKNYPIIGGSIMLMGAIVILIPITTPETYKLFSYQKARIIGRLCGVVLELLGLWIFLTY